MADNILSCSIIGGIGDIIFGLQGMKEVKESMYSGDSQTKCHLITHATGAIELVKCNPYIDRISVIDFKDDLSHYTMLRNRINAEKNHLGDAKLFCYTINPDIPLLDKHKKKAEFVLKQHANPLIVLHPCGSEFSRHFLGNIRKVSTKEIGIDVWQRIIKELYVIYDNPSIILIGSKEDYDTLNAIKGNGDLAHIFAGNLTIPECIAVIQKSKLVIGVDSFAKSVSLASKIPTVVFINDHDDKFRDEVFLNPYENEKYSCILRNSNTMSIDDMLGHIKEFAEGIG